MTILAMTQWSDYPLNRWMVVLSLVLLLATLNRFAGIMPYLINGLIDWKANIRIEASIPRARTRNLTALCLVIPFCLIAGRYSLLTIDALDFIPASLSLLEVLSVFIAFILTKRFIFLLLRPTGNNASVYRTALSSELNAFILLSIIELTSTGTLTLFGAGDSAIKKVLLFEIGMLYVWQIFRKGQILSSACKPFSTFLYLCGLEILPAGLLILANVRF